MSQIEYTDLICKARRQELSPEEQRRLDELVQSSLEARLMSHMLSEFERESRVRTGDDVLLARIQARALGAPEKIPSIRRRTRPTTWLLVAAVLFVATLSGAWLGSTRRAQPTKVDPAAPPASVATQSAAKPKRSRPLRRTPPAEPVTPVEPLLELAPKLEPSAAVQPTAAPTAQRLPQRALPASAPNPASELFARANLLRRQGRNAEAAGLYRLLLELYPTAREVGPTRLALAKHLHAQDPARALAEYRALAGSGGPLRAEALWGVSECAASVGESALARQALSDLLREFPDSAYAEVARARMLDVPR